MFRFPRFLSNESGMTLPMMALAFSAIIGAVGVASDIGRYQLVQSRLSFALDAAGLAAGASANTRDVQAEAEKYMNANFPANYLGSLEARPIVNAVVSADGRTIDLNATITVPAIFMRAFGATNQVASAASQITLAKSGLELVLALDVTGSMGSNNKIGAMKTAATTLVNTLFNGLTANDTLWIGLVPFSNSVNVGNTATTRAWLSPASSNLIWGPGVTTLATSWNGCVEAREANQGDLLDTPPSQQPYNAYYARSTDNLTGQWVGSSTSFSINNAAFVQRPLTFFNNWVAARDANGVPTAFSLNELHKIIWGGVYTYRTSPNMECQPTQLTPMTNTQATLIDSINALAASGNTHVNLGAIWAWNMLSPRWRGQWGGAMDTNGLPLDYEEPHMNKAVVLLTDGENTTGYHSAYGYHHPVSDGRLSSSTALNTKLATVCTRMKEQGIYVYTIGFQIPANSVIDNLMRNCATAPTFYFNSPTNEQLQTVFRQIADSLAALKVSK